MSKIKRKYPKWIDEYFASVYDLFQGMDQRTLEPLSCWGFHPLYSDLWLEKLYQLIIKTEKHFFKRIVKAAPAPSSLRAILEFVVVHYNNITRLNYSFEKKKVRKILNFLIKVLRAKNIKDIFAYQSNLGHSTKQIKNLIKKIKWAKGTPEISQNLGKLFLALSSLVNGLMNDWCTDNGLEIWGPYKLSKDKILVIREFPHLRPVELWPYTKSHKHSQIKVFTVYKNVDLKIEFVGCHTVFQGDLAKGLVKYAVEVDGKYVNDLAKIKKLTNYYLRLAQSQYQRVRKSSFESLKQKVLEQEHYQFKDIFDLVGEDWRPSSEIRARVKNKKIKKNFYPLDARGLSKTEIKKEFGIENLKKLYS